MEAGEMQNEKWRNRELAAKKRKRAQNSFNEQLGAHGVTRPTWDDSCGVHRGAKAESGKRKTEIANGPRTTDNRTGKRRNADFAVTLRRLLKVAFSTRRWPFAPRYSVFNAARCARCFPVLVPYFFSAANDPSNTRVPPSFPAPGRMSKM